MVNQISPYLRGSSVTSKPDRLSLKTGTASDDAIMKAMEEFQFKLSDLGCSLALVYGFDKDQKPIIMTGGGLTGQTAKDSIRKLLDLAEKSDG